MAKNDWIEFEKIVAAIQKMYSGNCTVKWNERIAGRQFDVSIKFSIGPHEYLTLIECKKVLKPVSAEKIDAFVTKVRDVKGSKGIIVSATGFQSGAIEVAKRHGIELFVLKEVLKTPEEIQKSIIIPTFYMCEMKFVKTDGKLINFPDKDNECHYWIDKTIIQESRTKTTLRAFLEKNNNEFKEIATEELKDGEIIFQPDSNISLNQIFEKIPVRSIRFKYKIHEACLYSGPKIDPFLLQRMNTDYEYSDAIKGGIERIPLKEIVKKSCPQIIEGKFYKDLLLGFNFYIDDITNEILTVYLVESYQHGSLFQAVFKQEMAEAKTMSLITDKKEIRRLEKFLIGMKRKDSKRNV